MLNLVSLNPSRHTYLCASVDEREIGVCRFAQDSSKGYLFIADLASIRCYKEDSVQVQNIWEAEHPVASEIVAVEFCSDKEAVFIAYATGELFLFKEGSSETVYDQAGGVLAVQWSPDEEKLALVTPNHHLLLLSSAWEVLAELNLNEALQTANKHVTVSSVELSWRGDGGLLAVSVGELSQRELLILDGSQLKLQAMAESQMPLLRGLAWQPNGRHLYAVGASEEMKPQVCLFESNGLAHGTFDLRSTGNPRFDRLPQIFMSPSGQVQSMAWNLDSQLLGIVLTEGARWEMQIWRRSNWHWYLVYEGQWSLEGSCAHILWSSEEALELHLWIQVADALLHLTMRFMTDTVVSPNGTAAVIDGHRLHLTPLQHVIIPPPLSAAIVDFGAPIQSVAFSGDTHEKVAALLADDSIGVAHCPNQSHWEDAHDATGGDGEEIVVKPKRLLNACFSEKLSFASALIWLSPKALVICGLGSGDLEIADVMIVVTLEESGYALSCRWVGTVPLDFPLLKPMGVQSQWLYLQSTGGEIYSASYNPAAANMSTPVLCPMLAFPGPCPSGVLGVDENGVVCIVGRDTSGRVYVGKKLLMENVTSLTLHSNPVGQTYLLLTTRESKLYIRRFWNLFQTELPLETEHREAGARPGRRSGATAGMHAAMMPSISHSTSFFERPIEQGALLVASPPGGVDVVFHMPRGNLEVVSLRLFVLQEILRALEARDVTTAWKLSTLHRVDLNVIVDYKWPHFLSETDHFLTSVSSPDDVCDLMTALQQGNLFEKGSPYCACLPDETTTPTPETCSEKVTTVCGALRSAMKQLDEDLYCKAIVLSYARCDPPELENALLCVKSLREKEIQQCTGMSNDATSHAGEALKHLMLYVETAELYRVALSLYDLGLAYMIVTHSQRDPGEYLIELDQFAALESESYRKAKIDCHLHRFSHALKHLLASGSAHLDETIDLATEHHLFHELVSQMQGSEEERKTVMKHYGHWLKGRGMQEDAGAAFLAAEELSLALDSYQSCGEWQMTFILASKLEFLVQEIKDLATDVIEELKSMERFADAATVSLEYLDDSGAAIQFMTDARQWREAVRLSHRFNNTDLIDSVIAPSAAAAAAGFIQEFSTATESVLKYSTRLKEVHSKRQVMDQTIGQTGAENEGDEAASTVAGLSLYTEKTQLANTTGASSTALTVGGKKPKNRPKRQKKLKIKQGSPEEESALIEHLDGLKPDSRVLEEVSQLNAFLVFMGHLEDARKLQTTLDTLIKTQSTAVADLPSLSLLSEVTSVRWKWDILRDVTSSR